MVFLQISCCLKDCLVKQGLTTQKAESLLRTLSKNCNNITYDIEQAKNTMKALVFDIFCCLLNNDKILITNIFCSCYSILRIR